MAQQRKDPNITGGTINGSGAYHGNKQDSFIHPVGSISVVTDRHRGNFSPDNYYASLIQGADNKQDEDAAYSKAVDLEADMRRAEQDREYAQKVLEEQRAYDSPAASAARERMAGLNPDLAGSSSSGGSSGAELNFVPTSDTSDGTPFKNQYQDVQNTIAGIGVAAQSLSAFSGALSSIMSAIDTISTLPTRNAVNRANANLAQAQADEVNDLLQPRKENIGADTLVKKGQATLQGLNYTSNLLGQLANVSELFGADVEDDVLLSHLGSLGFSEDESKLKSYAGIVRQMQAHPDARSRFAGSLVDAGKNEYRAHKYTPEYVARVVDMEERINYATLKFSENKSSIESKYMALLNNSDYVEQIAGNEAQAATYQGQQLEYNLKMLETDMEAFGDKLDQVKKQIIANDTQITEIMNNSKTEEDHALIRILTADNARLNALGSHELNELYTIANRCNRLVYLKNTGGAWQSERERIFMDNSFNDIIHHTKTGKEIAADLFGDLLVAYGISRGAKTSANATVQSAQIGAEGRSAAALRGTRQWQPTGSSSFSF